MSLFLISLILWIIALPPLLIGIWGLVVDKSIKKQGVETDARVVGFKFGGGTAAPIVEYRTEQGVIRSKSWFSMSHRLYGFGVGGYDPHPLRPRCSQTIPHRG